MERQCAKCGKGIRYKNRHARTCSTRCRVALHRDRTRTLPSELTRVPRWVAWRYVDRNGTRTKLPVVSSTGRAASVTDPATWSTYAGAVAARDARGLDGVGIVLDGSGLACIDLDHCLDAEGQPSDAARRFLDQYPGAWVEVSVSGRGLHIWGTAPAGPGRRYVTEDGLSVETYTRGRYIAITGKTFRRGRLDVALWG